MRPRATLTSAPNYGRESPVCLRLAKHRNQLADVGRLFEGHDPAVPEREDVHPPEIDKPATPLWALAARPEHDHLIARRQEVLRLELGNVERVQQQREELAYGGDALPESARGQVRSSWRPPRHVRIESRENSFDVAVAERGIHGSHGLEIL